MTNSRRPRLAYLLAAVTGLTLAVGTPTATAATEGPTADSAVVRTADGLVGGRLASDHRIFEGIPYAAPPVGDRRLRAPQPVEPWTGVRDATAAGSRCAQVFVYPPGAPPQFSGSEDCLYLNLHVPRGANRPLPVMVFLHGGGFASGLGSAYDPRRITRQGNVIVVTLNYRLGALGFLRHPALRDADAGNFGIADQQAALRWVRSNVAAFGGDARNVTLWGESAGAYSVCAQLASPRARGLFDKAVVQSGPCGNDLLTRQEADRRGLLAAADLGCPDPATVAECLRRVPAERLAGLYTDRITFQRIAAALPWWPVAGTPLIPLQPLQAARAGLASPVPLVHGGTRDEMRALIIEKYDGIGRPLTAAEYPAVVRELYGRDATAVLAEYPLAHFDSPSLALATLLTDEGRFQGACQQFPYNDAAARRGPVFAYEYAEPNGQHSGNFPHGAPHGADVRVMFDSYLRPSPPLPAPQQRVAETMIRYWTTFARTGNPGPDWPTYRHGHGLSISAHQLAPANLAHTHHCGFWHTQRPEARRF